MTEEEKPAQKPKPKRKRAAKKKVEKVEIFQPYIPLMWKGVIPVYKCIECGWVSEIEDNMILHCVAHLPEAEQETALELLVKE
jgi:hypothetical protein